MIKEFSPSELAEMRADLERNPGAHGLSVVAQLHACKKADIIASLWLNPDDFARKPQVKVTPEQKADAVARAAKGEPLKDIAQDVGVIPATVSAWVRQAKKGTETPPQPEKADKAPAPQRLGIRLSAVAQSHFEDLDAAIDYMRRADLLSDEELPELDRYLALLGGFTRGLEYAEEHMERSAE